jgi:hypothetical protein
MAYKSLHSKAKRKKDKVIQEPADVKPGQRRTILIEMPRLFQEFL